MRRRANCLNQTRLDQQLYRLDELSLSNVNMLCQHLNRSSTQALERIEDKQGLQGKRRRSLLRLFRNELDEFLVRLAARNKQADARRTGFGIIRERPARKQGAFIDSVDPSPGSLCEADALKGVHETRISSMGIGSEKVIDRYAFDKTARIRNG